MTPIPENPKERKSWLFEKYWVKELSIPDIAKATSVPKTTITLWMKKLGIPRRTKSEAFKGSKGFWYGKKMPKETRQKMSKSHSGKHAGERNCMYGKKATPEHRRKISDSIKNHIQNNGCAMTGRYRERSNNWQGGRTTINENIRTCRKYKEWRSRCFKRDDYTCQICSKQGRELHVDHIVPLAVLITKFNIKAIYEANKCKDLWDTDNGRTLCENCHKNTNTWGHKTTLLVKAQKQKIRLKD
jgi:hypothetical protein